jgi:aminoglycoside phosphotransferase (APT) family kinase protein
MGREYAFLSRLNPFFRFAPRAYAYCDDEAIVGSAFCVLERITGVIVRRSFPPELLPELPPRQFNALIDTLADLHAVDVAVAGLAGLGRPEGYRRRQVEGWIKRLEAARTPTAGDFGKIVSWMVARMDDGPSPAAIVHNDFKLDNLVWSASDPAALIGVLDWEMATIGDPLMDLACTLSFWVSAEDPSQFRALRAMPTLHPGVPSRIEAAERYAARTKRPIDDLAFYECFGFFRRAVIEQQKYARFVRGDVNDSRFETLDRAVEVLRQMCLGVIERSPRV